MVTVHNTKTKVCYKAEVRGNLADLEQSNEIKNKNCQISPASQKRNERVPLMKQPKITIIDTGYANFASVKIALDKIGIDAKISSDASDIKNADKLVLPGVGTAAAAMQKLKERNLIDLIKEATQPLLGICLGMQLLAENSDETAGEDKDSIECLGLIKSTVKLIDAKDKRLPHMGWNEVNIKTDHPLLKGIPNKSYFYFVHSYCMTLSDATVAECDYGENFSAIVASGNFMGTQFHPEKSGEIGSKLLTNFVEI